jgi:hypothetical protein
MLANEVLRSQWLIAAERLGIRAEGPVEVPMPTGQSFEFAVLVPSFGSPLGTLIHPEYHRGAFTAAIAAGYATSTYLPDATEDVDAALDSYVDCLRDWGWCGAAEPPVWLASEEDE